MHALPSYGDGRARPNAASSDGVTLSAARRDKEDIYPELVGTRGRYPLVVLAAKLACD